MCRSLLNYAPPLPKPRREYTHRSLRDTRRRCPRSRFKARTSATLMLRVISRAGQLASPGVRLLLSRFIIIGGHFALRHVRGPTCTWVSPQHGRNRNAFAKESIFKYRY